jgi:phage/plasmid-like protein (TIGR03299 family)
MAHEFESGFMVGEPAWHGLGNLIPKDKRLSVKEAIEAAGLTWEVGLLPLQIANNAETTKLGLANNPVRANCVYRKTDNSLLGVVGPGYTPYQNWELFDWFAPFIDAGTAEFHTAGSLKDGKVVWALASLQRKEMEIAKGDMVKKFLLLSNSHDGTHAIRVGFTPIRVVCANTLAAAFSSADSNLIRAKHRKNVAVSMDKIRETINVVDAKFEATAEQYRFLANHHFNRADLEKYVAVVWRQGKADQEKELSTRSKNQLSEVFRLLDEGHGHDIPSIQGTWWQAYNAVAEYLSYESGSRSKENRMQSLWFGAGMVKNQYALHAAMKMAEGLAV